MSRAQVVKLIDGGKTFCTATKSTKEPGTWNKGAAVNVFPVETRFIKTTADKRENDNLENLSSF